MGRHSPEGSATARRHVIQVHQHGAHPLATVCTKGTPSIRVGVDAVIVLHVALAIGVACNLWKLHVTKRLAGERLDLCEEQRARM